jgi:hypothetical protein
MGTLPPGIHTGTTGLGDSMVSEDSGYRYWCVTCDLRHPHDVKHKTAINAASDHAAHNGGHTVFILRHGMSTLEVFWFPPHAVGRLPIRYEDGL